MKTRIMLDLETLGTAPGSAILAIGAVKFTGGQITGEFYEAWRAVHGVEPAWAHRKSMCYRTVKNLYPEVPMPRTGTHHNALDDARSQAMHLMAMIPTL